MSSFRAATGSGRLGMNMVPVDIIKLLSGQEWCILYSGAECPYHTVPNGRPAASHATRLAFSRQKCRSLL